MKQSSLTIWKQLLSRVFLPFFLCLLLGCQSERVPQGAIVAVLRVTNQQELELAGLSEQPEITEQVKLAGIQIPSLAQQPWGKTAKERLEQMTQKQSVLLETENATRDDDGQRSVYAWLNGALLNEKLVAEGYALVIPQPLNSKYEQRLSRAQDRARILGLGIWNPQNPLRQDPSEFQN